jgi:hypothetical protein
MQKIGGLNGYYWKWCIVSKSILPMSKEINIGNEARGDALVSGVLLVALEP